MWLMSEPGLGKPQMAPVSRTPHAERARPVVGCKTTGRSRHLADDGRHFTDRAVRFAGIVGIVNAAPVVIFSVAQQSGEVESRPDVVVDYRDPEGPLSARRVQRSSAGSRCLLAGRTRGGPHVLVMRDAAEQEFGATKVRGQDTTVELPPASQTLRSCLRSARIALLGP
jgi:hypothetical protein